MPRQPGTALPDPALVTLAQRVQATFLRRGLSLADPETAEVFSTSVDALMPILTGALATGALSRQQYDTLSGMFAAAGSTPAVLEGVPAAL